MITFLYSNFFPELHVDEVNFFIDVVYLETKMWCFDCGVPSSSKEKWFKPRGGHIVIPWIQVVPDLRIFIRNGIL